MINIFANSEYNLGRAGLLLILEIIGAVACGLAFSHFNLSTDYIFAAAWLFNLVPAWYISRAAQVQRKSRLFYGCIAALAPAGAIAASLWLFSQDNTPLLAIRHNGSQDEA